MLINYTSVCEHVILSPRFSLDLPATETRAIREEEHDSTASIHFSLHRHDTFPHYSMSFKLFYFKNTISFFLLNDQFCFLGDLFFFVITNPFSLLELFF